MRFYIKSTIVSTEKNIKESLILCITDLHYTKKAHCSLLPALLDKIKEINPHYICFLGDLTDDKSWNIVVDWLNSLAKIAPVMMINGNHDLKTYLIEGEKYKVSSFLPLKIKEEIKNIPKLAYLENNQTLFTKRNISFLGTNFYHDSMEEANIAYFQNNVPVLNSESFNILLNHNPNIMNEEFYRSLPVTYQLQISLILSGHTHNGLVPKIIDQLTSSTKGFYNKNNGLFPNLTRNELEIKSSLTEKAIKGIIVPPLTTIPNRNNYLRFLNNKLYDPGMQLVRVKKD